MSKGVKSSQKIRFSREKNRWRKWDEKFYNAKTRRIEILVHIFGINYLEEVFGFQVTLVMLRSLRFQLICLVRLKKPSGKDRKRPNNGNLKHGKRVPRNTKGAANFDKDNIKCHRDDAILKKLEAFMSMSVFKKILSSLRK